MDRNYADDNKFINRPGHIYKYVYIEIYMQRLLSAHFKGAEAAKVIYFNLQMTTLPAIKDFQAYMRHIYLYM